MQPVGHQCGRADAATGAHAVDGDELVACEPDEPHDGDPPGMVEELGVHEPLSSLPAGNDGGDGDHGHDEDAGEVFGTSVAIRVAPVRRASTQPEGNGDGYGGEGVRDVVDGVRKQGDRSGDREDGDLENCGETEPTEADAQGPEAFPGGRGRVDQLGLVVAVRGDELADGTEQPAALVVDVLIDLVVVSRVIVVMSHGHGSSSWV